MAIDLQNLASISSLSYLKVDDGGQLQARGRLETLGHRIKDAFRSLSEHGRTEIAARNERIMDAMRTAVENASLSNTPGGQRTGEKLGTLLHRIQNTLMKDESAAYRGLTKAVHSLPHISQLRAEPGFQSLPAPAQKELERAFRNIVEAFPKNRWQSMMDMVKNRFYGPYGMAQMMDGMHTNIMAKFRSDVEDAKSISGMKVKDEASAMKKAEQQITDIVAAAVEGKSFSTKQLGFDLGALCGLRIDAACQQGVSRDSRDVQLSDLQEAAQKLRNDVGRLFSDAVDALSAAGVDVTRGAVAQKLDDARKAVDSALTASLKEESFPEIVDEEKQVRGIHRSFITDTRRGSLSTINGQPVQGDYIQALRALVGEEHAHYLPFISAMPTQSGMEYSFFHIMKSCGFPNSELAALSLNTSIHDRQTHMSREGNDIVIRHSGSVTLATSRKQPLYDSHYTATIRIHLDQPGTTMNNAKFSVDIPAVSFEDLSLTFGTPEE